VEKRFATELAFLVTAAAPRAERAARIAEVIRSGGQFHWVGLYEVAEESIRAIAWTGTGPPADPSFPRHRGLNGAAVRSGAMVVVNDVASDPRYLTTFASTGAEMVVPVLDELGSVVGTVDVESPHVGAFGAAEQQLVGEAARLIAALWCAK